jgi:histidinol-phosphate aminotransferase
MRFSRRRFVSSIGPAAAMAFSGMDADAATTFAADAASNAATIMLNRNENPYGCASSVLEAIKTAAPQANRYPGIEYAMLQDRLGKLHSVKPSQVVLGCGSVEVLQLAADTFLAGGNNLVVARPTYAAVTARARLLGAEVREVQLAPTWSHDLNTMRARVDEQTRLIYICNPNSPTSSITPRKEIDAFLASLPENVHVLLDEAYHHYVNPSGFYSSFIEEPSRNRRVIVVRTFSTIYGLAGMRVGYAVAPPDSAALMQERKLQQGVGNLAARAALAALNDEAWIRTCAQKNADDRQEFINQVNARMLRAIDPSANFAMLNVMGPAERIIEHFAINGVMLAPKYPSLDKYVRISFGTPEEMKRFWRIWDDMHLDMQM